jgi:hypothetical protein
MYEKQPSQGYGEGRRQNLARRLLNARAPLPCYEPRRTRVLGRMK